MKLAIGMKKERYRLVRLSDYGPTYYNIKRNEWTKIKRSSYFSSIDKAKQYFENKLKKPFPLRYQYCILTKEDIKFFYNSTITTTNF